MATQTWYLIDGAFGSPPAWRVTDASDPGTEAYFSNNDGWIAGTGSTNRSKYAKNVERASNTFDSTTYPDGTPDTTLLDCIFIGVATQTGTYDAGNWVFTFCVRAQTNPNCSGKVHIRMFKSPNRDGTSLTEITSGDQAGTTVSTLLTTVTQDSVVTFNPGAVTLSNDYIFLQVAWERTGGGSMTTSDVDIRIGNASGHGSRIVTPNFSPPTPFDAYVSWITGDKG